MYETSFEANFDFEYGLNQRLIFNSNFNLGFSFQNLKLVVQTLHK